MHDLPAVSPDIMALQMLMQPAAPSLSHATPRVPKATSHPGHAATAHDTHSTAIADPFSKPLARISTGAAPRGSTQPDSPSKIPPPSHAEGTVFNTSLNSSDPRSGNTSPSRIPHPPNMPMPTSAAASIQLYSIRPEQGSIHQAGSRRASAGDDPGAAQRASAALENIKHLQRKRAAWRHADDTMASMAADPAAGRKLPWDEQPGQQQQQQRQQQQQQAGAAAVDAGSSAAAAAGGAASRDAPEADQGAMEAQRPVQPQGRASLPQLPSPTGEGGDSAAPGSRALKLAKLKRQLLTQR
jgi:hypothetical protein